VTPTSNLVHADDRCVATVVLGRMSNMEHARGGIRLTERREPFHISQGMAERAELGWETKNDANLANSEIYYQVEVRF